MGPGQILFKLQWIFLKVYSGLFQKYWTEITEFSIFILLKVMGRNLLQFWLGFWEIWRQPNFHSEINWSLLRSKLSISNLQNLKNKSSKLLFLLSGWYNCLFCLSSQRKNKFHRKKIGIHFIDSSFGSWLVAWIIPSARIQKFMEKKYSTKIRIRKYLLCKKYDPTLKRLSLYYGTRA